MTFTMSTEGDSVKSALSEANDKNVTDNHTDSSQDSTDAKDAQLEKPVENNISDVKEVEKPAKEDSTEGESDQESETSEKKDDVDAKKSEDKPEENEKKPENDTEAVNKEEKEAKSEEEEEEEEEEDEEEEEEAPKKKEEKETKDTKDVKEPKEKDEKASTASEKDEEEEEAEGEEEDEESEKEEKKQKPEKKGKKKGVPLLDQPLETSGKRERKNVQRFEEGFKEKESTKFEVESGAGTPLGEIPRIEASMSRFKVDDMKVLHKLLFKSSGKSSQFKKNIKKFSGFAFKKDSEDYKKKLESCHKIEVRHLRSICEMLDLQKSGNKDEIASRIMDFLLEPKDSGKPAAGGRPKRASAVRANNRGYSSHDDYSSDDKHSSRARRDKGKRPNLKDESSSDEEFKPGDASDASDEKPRIVNKRKRGRAKKGSSEEDEASISGASSDESDDVPTSKRRKSVTKAPPKAKPKTPARGRGRSTKSAPAVATPSRKSGRERKPVSKRDSSDEDEKADEGSSSEDEPLVKKKAKTNEPPTDDEIKTYVKSILEGANLEEITMKTVCQRVYDNYPDFDLTARKNFIKSTVKSLIST